MCRTLMGNWSVLSGEWLEFECASMLQVHTVAAGGGSLLHFNGGRFQVGPDSAGAVWACLLPKIGPLAVTDANVMVGKLQPELFTSFLGQSRMSRWMRSCGRSLRI